MEGINNFSIVVANKKGGVGKTTIALNLVKEFDAFYISNEDSVLTKHLDEGRFIVESPPIPREKSHNIVYDFGGYVDSGVLDVVRSSDLVIIPTRKDYDSLLKTFEVVEEFERFNKNIIIVVTQIQINEFDEIRKSINEVLSTSYPIVEIRASNVYFKTLSAGRGIREYHEENNFTRHMYASPIGYWNTFIEQVKEKLYEARM